VLDDVLGDTELVRGLLLEGGASPMPA